MMYQAANRLEPDTYHRLARAVFAEMACAGMSVVGEFHYLHHQANGTPYANPNAMGEALLAAASEAGIRITLLDTIYLHSGLTTNGPQRPEGVQNRFTDRTEEQWVKRVSDIALASGQRLGAAVHSIRAVNRGAITAVSEWARAHGAPLHAHVSEQVAENEQCQAWLGCTPTALLESVGALETNFTAVHATHLTDRDIEMLGDGNCTVCMLSLIHI